MKTKGTTGIPKHYYDDPGRLARFYSERVGDDTMSTPKGRQAAARGLAETYGVSEKEAASYLYYYFPNTTGRHGRQPRTPFQGAGKRGKPREGADPGTMSFQCSTCHKFYAGPDYGLRPRREMRVGPSGAEVSHGFCSKKCRDEALHSEEKRPNLNAIDANARERARRQALQRGRGKANQ